MVTDGSGWREVREVREMGEEEEEEATLRFNPSTNWSLLIDWNVIYDIGKKNFVEDVGFDCASGLPIRLRTGLSRLTAFESSE